jgi:para-aminobenzoate synthetase component 1
VRRDEKGDFYYHSGGGITWRSDAKEEYNELLEKIYVPTV